MKYAVETPLSLPKSQCYWRIFYEEIVTRATLTAKTERVTIGRHFGRVHSTDLL
jgi:hypothetical protein